MKKLSALLLLAFAAPVLFGQVSFERYHSLSDLTLTSPGALRYGLYGYDNPALLTYVNRPDFLFTWSDATGKFGDFNRWGFFGAWQGSGFGVVQQKTAVGQVTDYRFSSGFGNKAYSFGFGYGWSAGSAARALNRTSIVTLGSLARPIPHVSVGAMFTASTKYSDHQEIAIDVGGRPLGNELLTLFADYALLRRQKLNQGNWSAGVAAEPLPGVRVTARYFDTKALAVGFHISFGNAGLSTQAHFDSKQEYQYNSSSIRFGAYDRNMIVESGLLRNKRYVEMNLLGPVAYQRFQLFDRSNTLKGLIDAIDAAKSDGRVAGIAINTSGMAVGRQMMWELREKLRDFKTTGKRVIMFVDRINIDQYHFVSVADKIVMDPYGFLTLEGYLMGRAYFKGTLEKIGVGVDELRFFKYKSAVEGFSRDKMSEADREQLQAIVDDRYAQAKADICQARNIPPDQFDKFVDQKVLFLAEEAVAQGLADTLGRWSTVEELIKNLEGEKKSYIKPGSLARFQLPPDNHWGEKPRVAVIYALGVCAMDEGITARKLIKDVEKATEDKSVKAIVLRVDSPGGDAMASDYIALALKKAKEKKPVIISQGAVAASGGYWLSMYGDTIVAAPNTITGSIGVIGAWLYNKGLREWLGVSTDFVKVGEHADLGFGFLLPDRPLKEDERAKFESTIKILYKDFVGKVAEGRRRTYDDIEPIAQGRVWTGTDGLKNGLVDVIGGLETAIDIARTKAKLTDITIIEYPKKGLFDPSALMPRLFGAEVPKVKDDVLSLIKFQLKHNGKPLPMMPIEDVISEVLNGNFVFE